MKVACEKCGAIFDDVDHLTYCPHDFFHMHTTVITKDGRVRVAHSIQELNALMERQ